MDPNPPRHPRGRARGQSKGQPRGASFNQGQPRGFPSAQVPPSRPRPNMPGQFNPRQEFRPQNVRNIFVNSK